MILKTDQLLPFNLSDWWNIILMKLILTMTSFHNLYGCLAMFVKVKGELIKVIIIYLHLYLIIIIRDDFGSADPCSMQDACHIRTQLNDLTLHEFSWLSGESGHPVLGSHGLNSCRGLNLSLFRSHAMLISSPFTLNN